VVRAESFGVIGDGRADDTAALQRALDSLAPRETLALAGGRSYRHTAVLRIRKPGSGLSGPGTLLATNEAASAVWVEADDVTIDGGITLKMSATTKRWSAYEQMKLRIAGHARTTVRQVTIDGSAAGGVYIGNGAAGFTLIDVTVRNTRADGIHLTSGAHDGTLLRPRVIGSGDDGVAVVSYGDNAEPVRNITVESPFVERNSWGRGVSVVGGDTITYRNVTVVGSAAAAVYIASEGRPYFTHPSRRVRVLGGRLVGSNTDAKSVHGAVLLFSGRSGQVMEDVTVDGLTIVDTVMTASRQVGVIGPGGFRDIRLTGIAVRGGPATPLVCTAGDAVRASGWSVNGAAYAPVV
jgi:hypothetical protein